MLRLSLRHATGLRYALLAVCLSVMGMGCAAFGARPQLASGYSGVAWQATDFRVMARTVDEAERELYTFTLVLEETQGNALTFTQLEHTIYHPGIDLTPASERTAIVWKLRPHSELRQFFYSSPYCPEARCTTHGRLTPWWNILLTGTNDQGQPVRVTIALAWPTRPSAAALKEARETLGAALPTTAVMPAVVGSAVPFATMGHTVLVHAMINHREPVTLLLDTGATRTMLTPDIARRLGISPAVDAPRSPIVMLGGQRAQMPLIRLDSLAVGDTAVADLQVGIFTSLPHTPFIDGLLGGDFLRHFTLKLDYARSRLQLIPPAASDLPSGLSAATPATVPSTLPIEIVGNHILVRALLNERETVTLLLDTGATHTMLTPAAAQRAGLQPALPRLTGVLQVVGGHQVRFPLIPLAALGMGEAVVENLQVGILSTFPGTRTVDGLLGGDFLEHFILTLDYSARRLQLTSAASGSRPGHEWAASGLPLAHTGSCMRPADWAAPEGCARPDPEAAQDPMF